MRGLTHMVGYFSANGLERGPHRVYFFSSTQ
jgi:hypothetical protein